MRCTSSAAGLLHDEARDVVRAFHQVGHRDHVADALAAILARETFHRRICFRHRVHQCPSVFLSMSREVEGR